MLTFHNAARDSISEFRPDPALFRLGEALKRQDYTFVTVSPATHERVNRREENETATGLREILGWSRKFDPSVISTDLLELMRQAGVVESVEGALRCLLRASTLDNQIFFHSAYPTHEADAVFFGPDTYRFADAIRQFSAGREPPVRRAIDIGCGAGPGAILLAKRYPDAEVLAADINEKALRLAAVNASLAGADGVLPCISNLLKNVEGNFDLIVSNPPYLTDPAKRAYRHGGGRYGAGLSLDILEASLSRLNPNGSLLLYTGSAIVDGEDLFLAAAEQVLRNAEFNWEHREMDPDIFGEELSTENYSDADRIAAVVLTVTRQA